MPQPHGPRRRGRNAGAFERMFKIDATPTFRRTVTVVVPDGDSSREETLIATFRVLPTTQVEKFNLLTTAGTLDFLRAAIVRLDDVAGADGKPVEYSEHVRDAVIDLTYARVALASTYFTEIAQARTGN
jgi:hypothetical protein